MRDGTSHGSGAGRFVGRPLEFQGHVLTWAQTNLRDLPWRRTLDPYAILVSEVMLQQTQVSRVLPRYESFLGRFATFADACRGAPAAGAGRVVRLGLQLPGRATAAHGPGGGGAARRHAADGARPAARTPGRRTVHGPSDPRLRDERRPRRGRHQRAPGAGARTRAGRGHVAGVAAGGGRGRAPPGTFAAVAPRPDGLRLGGGPGRGGARGGDAGATPAGGLRGVAAPGPGPGGAPVARRRPGCRRPCVAPGGVARGRGRTSPRTWSRRRSSDCSRTASWSAASMACTRVASG